MTETDNLYTTKPTYKEKEELTRQNILKKSLCLVEDDDGRLMTFDEFVGKKSIEEEPEVEAVDEPAEPIVENPVLYPMYKRINKEEEQADNLQGYTQLILKFIDGAKHDEEEPA